MNEPVVFSGGAFSNFARCDLQLTCPFTGELRTYATVEHRFQASKANSQAEHERIARLPSPKDAKRAGRQTRIRVDWEAVKHELMTEALVAKFEQDPFRAKLLATGQRPIIEESRHDLEWGARRTPDGWEGENRLGAILSEVRERIGGTPDHPGQTQFELEL